MTRVVCLLAKVMSIKSWRANPNWTARLQQLCDARSPLYPEGSGLLTTMNDDLLALPPDESL